MKTFFVFKILIILLSIVFNISYGQSIKDIEMIHLGTYNIFFG